LICQRSRNLILILTVAEASHEQDSTLYLGRVQTQTSLTCTNSALPVHQVLLKVFMFCSTSCWCSCPKHKASEVLPCYVMIVVRFRSQLSIDFRSCTIRKLIGKGLRTSRICLSEASRFCGLVSGNYCLMRQYFYGV